MATEDYSTRFLGPGKNVILVTFSKSVNLQELIPHLQGYFKNELSKGSTQWIFDFANLPFPTTSMIAFLISATQQARNAEGDVKLINMRESAKNNLVTFNPLSYLAMEENENTALAFFGIEIEKEKEKDEEKDIPTDQPDLQAVDIVEPVIWETTRKKEPSPETPSSTIIAQDEVVLPASSDGNIKKYRSSAKAKKETLATENRYHLRTESLTANLYKICDFVVEHAEKAGLEEKQVAKTKISVYEACLNVIEHAYHSHPDNWIDIWVEYNRDFFKVIIQDYGLSFDKKGPGSYNVEEAMEKRQTGGFGLHIIRRSMDVVDYVADPIKGNQLTLIKYLTAKHANRSV